MGRTNKMTSMEEEVGAIVENVAGRKRRQATDQELTVGRDSPTSLEHRDKPK